MKTYHLDTKFTFGKHFGLTLKEVMQIDTDYINWCEKNLDNLHFVKDYDDFDIEDYDDFGSDGGCGEGYSCDECDNAGCPAHPCN